MTAPDVKHLGDSYAAGGEIQLTDAIDTLNQTQRVFAKRFEGIRYDVGDKFGL